MKIAICDNEKTELDKIHAYAVDFLDEHMFSASIDCFESGEDLLLHISGNTYQLIILDIYMDGMTGIETAQKIREKDMDCDIIFITTSTDHALSGYQVKAIDYLIKPVSVSDFNHTLSRCFLRYKDVLRYIEVKSGRQKERIPVRSILWAEVYNHLTTIHTSNGDIRTHDTLDELEGILGGPPFFRISKSYLVQFKQVQKLMDDGFHMPDGSVIPLPSHHKYRKNVCQMYKDYLFSILHTEDFL